MLTEPSDDELPTFEEPTAAILAATQLQRQLQNPIPTLPRTLSPDYSSDLMPMDAWDGDTDKMSVQDFLCSFHQDVKVTTSSADKAKAFKHYLVANSEADLWFRALPAATKADMDLIDTAMEAQYPMEATVLPTPAEYTMELLKLKLTMELGTRKMGEREVWAHHACRGSKMLRLAAKAGVSATPTYIAYH
ncbi:hypothetical protein FB451DRAFT_1414508 [Mycena latifolia]|nr:hypothetical protein FB451DRAFT_1414508 [Mycena latifolia]